MEYLSYAKKLYNMILCDILYRIIQINLNHNVQHKKVDIWFHHFDVDNSGLEQQCRDNAYFNMICWMVQFKMHFNQIWISSNQALVLFNEYF